MSPDFLILEDSDLKSFFKNVLHTYISSLDLLLPNTNVSTNDDQRDVFKKLFAICNGSFQKISNQLLVLNQYTYLLDDFSGMIVTEKDIDRIGDIIFEEHKNKFFDLCRYYQAEEDPFAIYLTTIKSHLVSQTSWSKCIQVLANVKTRHRGSKRYVLDNSFQLEPEQLLGYLNIYCKIFTENISKQNIGKLSPSERKFFESKHLPGYSIFSLQTLKKEYQRYLWYSASRHVHKYFVQAKLLHNVLDYQDLVWYMNQAVKSTTILDQLSNKIHTLFVDEYQDTDPLQTNIFNTLKEKTGSRVIRIGDPNQSIYAFRGASATTYLSEKQYATAEELAYLSVNMRSHSNILDFINFCFTNSIDDGPQKEHISTTLSSSLEGYQLMEAHQDNSFVTQDYFAYLAFISPDNSQDNNERISIDKVRYLEAKWIAKKIKHIRSKPVSSSQSIVILLRSLSHAELYEQVLSNDGIVSMVVDRENIVNVYPLPPLLTNIFDWLYNPMDMISLIGVLRSVWVGLPDDIIANISWENNSFLSIEDINFNSKEGRG